MTSREEIQYLHHLTNYYKSDSQSHLQNIIVQVWLTSKYQTQTTVTESRLGYCEGVVDKNNRRVSN